MGIAPRRRRSRLGRCRGRAWVAPPPGAALGACAPRFAPGYAPRPRRGLRPSLSLRAHPVATAPGSVRVWGPCAWLRGAAAGEGDEHGDRAAVALVRLAVLAHEVAL